MTKHLSMLSIGLLSLTCFNSSFAAEACINIIDITNPITHARFPNICSDAVFLPSPDIQYQDLVSVKSTHAYQDHLRHPNKLESVICYENPYAPETALKAISVVNPTVDKVQVNLTSAEVFFNLINNGEKDHAIVSIKTTLAQQVQLQDTVKDKSGALNLKLVKQIPVKANQNLLLSERGYHVMLIYFNPHIRSMDPVPLTLTFEDGSKMNIDAQVACENYYQ